MTFFIIKIMIIMSWERERERERERDGEISGLLGFYL